MQARPLAHKLGSVLAYFFSLDADGNAGAPFGTQTGQRSVELTANYD